jgi:hypothetical protein
MTSIYLANLTLSLDNSQIAPAFTMKTNDASQMEASGKRQYKLIKVIIVFPKKKRNKKKRKLKVKVNGVTRSTPP